LSLSLIRLCGVAAIAGGALLFGKIIWDMMGIVGPYDPDITDTLFFFVPLLLLTGLAGFYVRYTGGLGALGQTGFLMGLSGLAAGVMGSLGGIWLEPLRLAYWLGFRFLCVGLVLVGVVALRERTLPRLLSAVALILGLLGWGRALFMLLEVTMEPTRSGAPEAQGALGAFLSLWAETLASVLGLLFALGWMGLGVALFWADKNEEV
jgi:hypothetical protein